MSIRVGIVGISGFGGGEAMRLVAGHPSFGLVYAAGEGSAGSRLMDRFPGVPAKLAELVIKKWDPAVLPKLDVLFASLPTDASAEALARVPKDVRIIDIGGDHRYVEGWAYGLADVWPAQIEGQSRVANPGCFPAATLTALAPLLADKLIEPGNIMIDAKTGISGAGRGGADSRFGYAESNENLVPYGLLKHVHMPEIAETIERLSGGSAAEQDRDDVARARAAWHADPDAGVGGISPERLVFLDECGALTNMACLHGWAPRGERALGTAPAGRWERITVLGGTAKGSARSCAWKGSGGALGAGGVVAAMPVEAAADAAVFTAYLDRVLLPKLREAQPDAVLVMDNLAAHKTPAVRALLDASGFAYRYLLSYSPDLNPIEQAWAKVKGRLRQAAARTANALHTALGPALNAITPQDAQGYFRHSGYRTAGPK